MKDTLNIGQMIKDYIEQNNLVRTHITQRMNTPNTAIYAYEKRKHIHSRTLARICYATNYNFFMDIANSLPKEFAYNTKLISEKEELIAKQAEEIYKLTLENNLLKELIKGKM